jgi:hypothetical protein
MRTVLRRSAITLGVLVATVIVAVWGGTFAEARVSVCVRSLDGDSLSQNGHASMHWYPPRVHCAYPADSTFGVDAASTDEAAVWGIVGFGLMALGLLFVLFLGWWSSGVIDVERDPPRRPVFRE